MSILSIAMRSIAFDSDRCTEFFELAVRLVQASRSHCWSSQEGQLNTGSNGHSEDAWLVELESCLQSQMAQSKNSLHTGPIVLSGQLRLLEAILAAQTSRTSLQDLTREIFTEYLFRVTLDVEVKDQMRGDQHGAICKTAESRSIAFNMLWMMVGKCKESMTLVLQLCEDVINQVPARVEFDWEQDPSALARSVPGFAGLKNHGCTCYINAVLQQLFMVPSFRAGITCGSPPKLACDEEGTRLLQLQETDVKKSYHIEYGEDRTFGVWSKQADGRDIFCHNDGASMCKFGLGSQSVGGPSADDGVANTLYNGSTVIKGRSKMDDAEEKAALLYEVNMHYQ